MVSSAIYQYTYTTHTYINAKAEKSWPKNPGRKFDGLKITESKAFVVSGWLRCRLSSSLGRPLCYAASSMIIFLLKSRSVIIAHLVVTVSIRVFDKVVVVLDGDVVSVDDLVGAFAGSRRLASLFGCRVHFRHLQSQFF